MNNMLSVVPVLLLAACAGTGGVSYRTAAVINEECGENCSRDETVIGEDTIVSKSPAMDRRITANIKKVKKGMLLSQLTGLVGPADCDCGCGIHVLVYVLKNRACYQIGTSDRKVLFVRRIKAKKID